MKAMGAPSVAVEVVNLSKFAIVISEVGLREGRWARAVLTRPILLHGEEWPKRLEPRESVTAYFDVSTSRDYQFTSRTRAYATTACDFTKAATSGALKEWTEVHTRQREWAAKNEAKA